MNRFGLLVMCTLAVLLVAGCTSQFKPEERNGMIQSADRPIICKAGPDCDEKWNLAKQWVTEHANYAIQTSSDTLIKTDGPVGLDKHAAYTVNKTVDHDDIYTIRLVVKCNNWFGCVPTVLQDRANFADFITPSHVDASKPDLGIRVTPVSAKDVQAAGAADNTQGGMLIIAVTPRSLADKTGLRVGDIIVQLDGKPVTTENTLRELVAGMSPGQKASILICRDKTMLISAVSL